MKKVLIYLPLALLLMFAIYMSLAPLGTLHVISESIKRDSSVIQTYDLAFQTKETSQLTRELAYKNALVALSEEDSIGLVINLNDSTVRLMIQGVTLHAVNLQRFSMDRLISRLPDTYYLQQFSRPVGVQEEYSSIVKEPVVVMQAPSSPLTAINNVPQPDTLVTHRAHVELLLDNQIRLILEQDKSDKSGSPKPHIMLLIERNLSTLWINLSRFASSSTPAYTPTLRVSLPASDMRAIYRALPAKPKVVLNCGNKI